MSKRSHPAKTARIIFQPIGRRPDLPTEPFSFRGPDELQAKIRLLARVRWGVGGEPVTVSMSDQTIIVGRTDVARFVVDESAVTTGTLGVAR